MSSEVGPTEIDARVDVDITVDLNVAVHVGVNTAMGVPILGGRDTNLEKRYELSED